MESQAIKDVVIGFNAKVQEMPKLMTDVYKSGVADALSSGGKAYANINLGIAQSEMIKSMNAMAESLSATQAIANSFTATKVMADSLASTKALTQSFAATQMLAESEKTAEIIKKSIAFPKWENISPIVSYDDDEQTEGFDEKTIEGDEEE